jgi:hypothetical protein
MSNVTSRPLDSAPRSSFNSYHVGAAIAQLGSLLTTYAFLAAVMHGAALYLVVAVSLVIEFLLTLGKSLLFGKRHDGVIGGVAVAFDTLLNAGGIWPYTRAIAFSPPAVMLTEAFALHDTMGSIPALVIAVVAGYLLAIAPHRLWKAAGRR